VDQIFALEEQILDGTELVLRADPVAPQIHAFVETASRVVLKQYEARLAETRPSWRRVRAVGMNIYDDVAGLHVGGSTFAGNELVAAAIGINLG